MKTCEVILNMRLMAAWRPLATLKALLGALSAATRATVVSHSRGSRRVLRYRHPIEYRHLRRVTVPRCVVKQCIALSGCYAAAPDLELEMQLALYRPDDLQCFRCSDAPSRRRARPMISDPSSSLSHAIGVTFPDASSRWLPSAPIRTHSHEIIL